jgi:hypothetical protein
MVICIAVALRENGKAVQSLRVLLSIQGEACALADQWEQAVVLQDLATALVWQEAWVAAEKAIEAISETRHQAEARRDFAIALAQKQKWAEAEHALAANPGELLSRSLLH